MNDDVVNLDDSPVFEAGANDANNLLGVIRTLTANVTADRLEERADTSGFSGDELELVECVNRLVDAFAAPIQGITETLGQLTEETSPASSGRRPRRSWAIAPGSLPPPSSCPRSALR